LALTCGLTWPTDRGGTFTDVVALRPDGELVTHKLLSENPEQCVPLPLSSPFGGLRRQNDSSGRVTPLPGLALAHLHRLSEALTHLASAVVT
jgi:hypothetical protein